MLADRAARPWPHPPYRLGVAEDRRLAVCLFVALLLHLLAFGLIGSPGKSSPLSARPLVVRWASPPPSRIAEEPDVAVGSDSSGKRPGVISRSDRQPRPGPSPSDADGTAIEPPPAMGHPVDRQPPAAVELMDSARATIREMAREQARHQPGNAMHEDRPVLAGLDRVLRKAKAGEERLADGLIRITTESGRVYCLKPPPDFARDGPVAMLSAPTNCP